VTEPLRAPVAPELPAEDTAVPPPGSSLDAILAALVAAMVAGAPVMLLARILGRLPEVTRTLAERILLGRSWAGLLFATADEYSRLPRLATPPVQVLMQIATTNAFRRAAYLANAVQRLAPAFASGDADRIFRAERAEDRYFEQFRTAEERRNAAGQRVALLAGNYGLNARGELLLNWRAKLDSRTSADCRWAHGRNFNALVMPPIGYPGMVHLFCRCEPGPARDTHLRVENGTPPMHS
jgi:hypothetical protein